MCSVSVQQETTCYLHLCVCVWREGGQRKEEEEEEDKDDEEGERENVKKGGKVTYSFCVSPSVTSVILTSLYNP